MGSRTNIAMAITTDARQTAINTANFIKADLNNLPTILNGIPISSATLFPPLFLYSFNEPFSRQ